MKSTRLLLIAALAGGVAMTASAQDQNPAVGARQGQFQLMALNLGVLGNMARGNTEYDAEAAQAAADNLLTISGLDQRFHWPEGTDNASIEGTRALPAIWEDGSRVLEIWGEFGTGAEGLAAVAGDGLAAMQGALGPVGAACGACHDDYRAPNN